MKTYYDVQQLLRRFGILVYMGNRLYDIEMSRIELEKVHEQSLIETGDFLAADLVLRQESAKEKAYQERTKKRKI